MGYLAGVEWPSEETVRTIDGYTAHPSEEVATAALLGLGQTIHNLSGEDPETARWALESLERKLAASGTSESHKIAGLLALGNARDERSLPLLERFSGEEAPALRAAAVAALGSYPEGSEAFSMIYSVIENDPDTAVLATAVEAVSRRPSRGTTVFLIGQASRHENREVRRRSLLYLGRQLHDPSVRRAVVRMAAQDADEAIRTEATRLLDEASSGE